MKKVLMVLLTLMFLTANLALAAVNINTADLKTLSTLPGIGEAKAAAIIQYRKEHGEFKSPKDLVKVKGVGDKLFKKIAKEIIVK
jgi:competence protein ComEA